MTKIRVGANSFAQWTFVPASKGEFDEHRSVRGSTHARPQPIARRITTFSVVCTTYNQTPRRYASIRLGPASVLRRVFSGGRNPGGGEAFRAWSAHLLAQRYRRAAVLFARRHGTSVQDLRRSQGGHGRAVEGGGRLRRAQPRGEDLPERICGGGSGLTGGCGAQACPRGGHQTPPGVLYRAVVRLLRAPEAVRREDRNSPEQGRSDAARRASLAPGRPLRRARRFGHGPEVPPHAPGPGKHGRLHQGGRLQGDERVPARRSDRDTRTQDYCFPPTGGGPPRKPSFGPGGGSVRTSGTRGGDARPTRYIRRGCSRP